MVKASEEVAIIERDLEQAKVDLAMREDFNLIDGFALIDYYGRGYVSSNELRQGLLDLGLRLSLADIESGFHKHNKEHDGYLKYSEYSELFLPSEPYYARHLSTKRLNYMSKNTKTPFDMVTLSKYLRVWDLAFMRERVVEDVVQSMRESGY